jgi:hypothetical protein
MATLTRTIAPGSRKDIVVQCKAQGGIDAVFAQGDALSAEVWPANLSSRLLVASASWYTSKGRQTGYDQGQVVLSLTSAQSATLQPSGRYWLRVFRTLSGTSETEEIATVLLKVRRPSPA